MKSVLSMEKLVFDEITFTRSGFRNDASNFEFEMEVSIGQDIEQDIYKVTLKLVGDKKEEYNIRISLSGFFSFSYESESKEELKKELLERNAVAIMMPYLRSQVSLITAQPDVDCVVLPPFNINNMLPKN